MEYPLSSSSSASRPPHLLSQSHPQATRTTANSDSISQLPPTKKRKVERACDACRRRKSKCDGPKKPDRICTSCEQLKKSCTYMEDSKPRGPPKAIITALEDKLERLETLLMRLRPECSFSNELGPVVIRDSWKREDKSVAGDDYELLPDSTRLYTLSDEDNTKSMDASTSTASPTIGRTTRPSPQHLIKKETVDIVLPEASSENGSEDDQKEVSDTDHIIMRFTHGFSKLNIGQDKTPQHDDNNARYAGKSSNMSTIHATQGYKEKHLENLIRDQQPSSSIDPREEARKRMPHGDKRPEYWFIPPWEETWENAHFHDAPPLSFFLSRFPPSDLARDLIHVYFTRVNPMLPLLHRPTFEKHFEARLYSSNNFFAALCFTVFAVASRWSDDPRVLSGEHEKHGFSDARSGNSGFKFVQEALGIHRAHRSLIRPVTLFEIQMYTLIGVYMRGNTHYTTSWLFSGGGLCKLFDIGAHRKPIYSGKTTVESELFKRAFWVLFCLDRFESAMLGRPCSIGDEHFDAELPLEVDDEFWQSQDPAECFRQPLGRPPLVSSFNLWIRLMQITSRVLRTNYSTGNLQLPMLLDTGMAQRELQAINKAMTEWVNSVPDHLKWSTSMTDETFSTQSATLYTSYYYLQLLLYRPFLKPPSSSVASTSQPSQASSNAQRADISANAQAICINAARRCAHIIQRQMSVANGLCDAANLILISHTSGAFLLRCVWQLKLQHQEARRAGAHAEQVALEKIIQELQQDIDVCIRALEVFSRRWDRAETLLRQLQGCLPLEEDAMLPQPNVGEEQLSQMSPVDYHQPGPGSLAPAPSAYPHHHQSHHPQSSQHPPRTSSPWTWQGDIPQTKALDVPSAGFERSALVEIPGSGWPREHHPVASAGPSSFGGAQTPWAVPDHRRTAQSTSLPDSLGPPPSLDAFQTTGVPSHPAATNLDRNLRSLPPLAIPSHRRPSAPNSASAAISISRFQNHSSSLRSPHTTGAMQASPQWASEHAGRGSHSGPGTPDRYVEQRNGYRPPEANVMHYGTQEEYYMPTDTIPGQLDDNGRTRFMGGNDYPHHAQYPPDTDVRLAPISNQPPVQYRGQERRVSGFNSSHLYDGSPISPAPIPSHDPRLSSVRTRISDHHLDRTFAQSAPMTPDSGSPSSYNPSFNPHRVVHPQHQQHQQPQQHPHGYLRTNVPPASPADAHRYGNQNRHGWS